MTYDIETSIVGIRPVNFFPESQSGHSNPVVEEMRRGLAELPIQPEFTPVDPQKPFDCDQFTYTAQVDQPFGRQLNYPDGQF